ncbi:acid phosphatase/Vanadium-dependent haloperoxidase [Tothia fuscella]|uniref:Acid phosphatase/Vanadium-dependent haloperoxidase n=1 Tax=Tothia fuscella TaxID=1048955 RepID=A0A9P4U068_9PEZI|nr:acid phosphatase/Vanadium-dependent haloperoxidase [Tothia fuscella]
MRLTLSVLALAVAAQAAYPGDIVQYWVDQSAILVNSTVIGGLQSPPSGWFEAIVQGAVYLAATKSHDKSLAFQQLAVSHAAHNTLQWTFHGTRLYATIDSKFAAIIPSIGINQTSADWREAARIGRESGRRVVTARADDGIHDYVPFPTLPRNPGVYQATPPGNVPIPDTPQAQYIRLFGGLGDVKRFRAPPPPSVTDPRYEAILNYTKAYGSRNSTVRSAYDTESAYFWRESSPIGWNRLANLVVGNKLSKDVLKSARFYAQLNYALANAAIASWDSKYFYNSWRPITAITRTDIWLPSGRNVSDPSWIPLLTPTPNHQDYLSTHATFGGAAGAVIRAYNGGDKVDVYLSSNVTTDNKGVITRRITNLTQAVKDNGDSRVFGGIHFPFASNVGSEIGEWVGRETLKVFDARWQEF